MNSDSLIKIIVQEICTYRQCILAEDMGIEGTDGVLTVGIIVVVSTLIIHISSLVILVEAVRNLQIIILRKIHHGLQSGRIIHVMIIIVAALAPPRPISFTLSENL